MQGSSLTHHVSAFAPFADTNHSASLACMRHLMSILALGLFALGMFMLLSAMTASQPTSVAGYAALWVGSFAAIVVAGVLHAKFGVRTRSGD